MRPFPKIGGLMLALFMAHGLHAETEPGDTPSADDADLAQRIEEIRLQSVNLARDLWLLEQDLGNEQGRLVIFVSVDPKLEDRLEEIELKLGDETVTRHDYSAAESEALSKGGTHRLYAASLDPGRHVLEAQLYARGDAGKIKQTAKLSFRGGEAPKNIELRLQATEPGLAELVIREWD
ncbi:MAG: hypothetical protein ACRESV_10315 [Nevskiales bacterium]